MTFTKVIPPFKAKNIEYPSRTSRWIDKDTGLRKNFDGTLEKPKFMRKNRRGATTKKEKRVMAKIMFQAGWGTKRLSEWFGTTQQNIYQWDKMPTPDALKEFEQRFKAAMMDYDMESTFKVKSRINELIPQETDINKLVKAGEFFDGQQARRTTQNNTQVNIYSDMLKRYKEDIKQ